MPQVFSRSPLLTPGLFLADLFKPSACKILLISFAIALSGMEFASAKNGEIGAYTKKSGGVTVKRSANGTIEVMDEETVYTPHSSAGFRSNKKRGSVGSYVRKGSGSTVKRNADGTVEVTDTSATNRKSSNAHKTVSSTKTAKSGTTKTAKTK